VPDVLLGQAGGVVVASAAVLVATAIWRRPDPPAD